MIDQIQRVQRDVTFHDYIPGQPIPPLVKDRTTGRIVINELKRYVKPFTLVTEPASITLAGNAISDPIPMPLDNKGHFEISQSFFVSSQSEGFTVTLFDPDERPFLMNREVHVATIASGSGVATPQESFGADSSAGRPFRWPESLFLNVGDHGKAIFAVFRNLSSNTNTIRFALHGLRWYHLQAPEHVANRMKEIYTERFRSFPYFYTTDQHVTLAGGASGEFQVRFGDEAWVEWSKAMRVSTGRFNIRIREKASDRRYMEQPIRDDLVFGSGELPMLLWESSLFEPNYTLLFELTDVSGSTNTIWITLACRRILWDPKEDRLARPAGGPP